MSSALAAAKGSPMRRGSEVNTRGRTMAAGAVVLGVLLVALAAPISAQAAQLRVSAVPSSSVDVTTTTNPIGWRDGWGNTLHPMFGVTGFEDAVGGLFYQIDRTPGAMLATDTASLAGYSRTVVPTGTHFDQTLDISGVFAFPPPGGWPAPPAGSTDPREGMWYWHILPYSLDSSSAALVFDPQIYVIFGIDVTPPRPVQSVGVSPNASIAASSTAVGVGSRVTVSWQGAQYDALSGTGYFSVYLDGARVVSGAAATATVETPVGQPPMWYDPAWPLPYEVTIEDLTPGAHQFLVTDVDLATNESAPSSAAVYYSDPDTPTIAWSPTPPSPVNAKLPGVFAVTAVDSCLKDVRFAIDGVGIGTRTADSATTTQALSVSKVLSGYSNGTHTVTAVAHDQYGRAATVTATFVLDKTAPSFSALSAPLYGDEFTSSTFYPMRHDGYWDTSTVRYHISEKSRVTLEVHSGSVGGDLLRTFTSNRTGAGNGYFVWDGRSSSGSLSTGTFYYVLRAADAAGNVSNTWTHVVRIKSYQVVRISKSRVKTIRR